MQVGITVITDKFLAGGFWHRDIIIYQTGHDLQGWRGEERRYTHHTPPPPVPHFTLQVLSLEFAQSSFTETVEDSVDDDQDDQDHGDDDDHFHSGLKG